MENGFLSLFMYKYYWTVLILRALHFQALEAAQTRNKRPALISLSGHPKGKFVQTNILLTLKAIISPYR